MKLDRLLAKCHRSVIGWLTALLLMPSVVVGQEQQADSTLPSVGDSTVGPTPVDAALDSVAALDGIIQFLDERAEGVAGDDERLLAERRAVRVEARRDLLWSLAEAAAQTTGEAGPSERVSTIDTLLAEDADDLRIELADLLARSSELRSELPEADGADRTRLWARIRQLDEQITSRLGDYHRSLTLRDSLGADVAEELAELDATLRLQAEFLAARMATNESDVDAVQERIAQGEPDLQTEVAALRLQGSSQQRALEGVLAIMEARDLDTADFRRFLLVTTGALTADNLSLGVVEGVVSDWLRQATGWLRENGANLVFKTLVFLAVIIVTWFAARLVRRLLRRAVNGPRVHLSSLAREMIVRWASRFVLMFGALMALSQIGVDLGPVLAGFGVAGFIVAFALQETLSNFAAGVMILLYRPFDVGDVVDVAGANGKIANMSLVSTTVLSFDNQRFVVPNNKIWGDVIRNVTALATRRVDLVFGIGYDDDVEKAEQVLKEVVHGHDLVLDDPAPVIKVSNLGESSVDFIARPWCRTSDYWDVYWDLTKRVKTRFDEEGISIPFPQRDVHLFTDAASGPGGAPAQTGESMDRSDTPELATRSSES